MTQNFGFSSMAACKTMWCVGKSERGDQELHGAGNAPQWRIVAFTSQETLSSWGHMAGRQDFP